MKVLIVEDEKLSADRLAQMVRKIEPDVEILAQIDSVKRTVEWLANQPAPDLLFLDIQLADGLSFEIFERVEVRAPIIFTTAYDEYAIKAFKVNSVDYLLKPIDDDELKAALSKFNTLTKPSGGSSALPIDKLESLLAGLTKTYKERFIIKVGDHLKSVEVADIDHFVSQEKATFAQNREGKRFIIDFTLDQAEALIDPLVFFRINRKYIVSFKSIKDIIAWSNSRLRLVLHNCDDTDVVVAREKVNAFKMWLDR
ncbi:MULTISPECIES: LytTR family DNA-binding domain-containing protein [unclassified Imperialibacter]|uniref:LytR/AlgR family response regulator transcription factor n=1 Tax=unclassified Imperialibacter TaxID=2629706 RepID=UPI00125BD29D|nr:MULTISPECIES: LytTR family DNA-binding domain-containing protein [unclassified Imperialibacter]CAD5266520.1 Two component transcriptional regulator, LytTR family [Imperialibacter sp. 89]CAD5281582.1 Two component transcriptional regulator, LytTR family [Imperialibacter sp. 75]VVT16766.1 Two component transcriptional regulator, LytTR family [Imperialibacter sp. EC-SDR9]